MNTIFGVEKDNKRHHASDAAAEYHAGDAAIELSEKQLDAVAGGRSQPGWNLAKNLRAA
ncbi:hypothetical protein [Bradyrhizobium sp. Tv2a-2]|uniref:hypothetical protein n=1 Tax=Bradyrhizobium sp. Tv2a-2 TaxID=113395 RepID=UPI000422DF88|nr:hypothetical protein [Bradyrhizobium sp. Tv2a-2]